LNSSSDSDSDPEGGELPEIITYKKEEEEEVESIPKKKLKKKRNEKNIEERVPKVTHKREVNKPKSFSISFPSYSFLLQQSKKKLLKLRLIVHNLSKQQVFR